MTVITNYNFISFQLFSPGKDYSSVFLSYFVKSGCVQYGVIYLMSSNTSVQTNIDKSYNVSEEGASIHNTSIITYQHRNHPVSSLLDTFHSMFVMYKTGGLNGSNIGLRLRMLDCLLVPPSA